MVTRATTRKHSRVLIVLVQTKHETRWQTLDREQMKCSEDTLLGYCSIPQAPTSLIGWYKERTKTGTRKKNTSEIRCLEYDRHFNSTSGTSFHSDHTNLCIGVVEIMTGESPEISYSCLGGRGGGRGPMSKLKRMRQGGLDKAWCKVRGNVAKGVIMFLIHLHETS